jgi:Transposase DDE domain
MDIAVEWGFFCEQLPLNWRERAHELGLIHPQPAQLGAKVTDIEPVMRLLLHRAGLEHSLVMTAADAAAAQVIDLSSVAVHKWERKLGPYFADLTAQLCDAPNRFGPQRWSGYDIFAVDATVVTRPGAMGTTARVHYVLRLSTLGFVRSVVTDEHVGETLRLYEDLAAPRQLWIADRCYANPPGIAALARKGAAIIVRYNRGALPLYELNGKPFDALKHVRTLRKAGAIGEWRVQIHSQDDVIVGRLCATRLPDDEAAEARERMSREQGAEVTGDSLEAASWLMVFTTVARHRMRAGRVLDPYRLRWQVELEAKRGKSIGGLDLLPNFREDTITTWLQAKLLIQHVAKKIASRAEAFPPSVAHWSVRALEVPTDAPARAAARSAHRLRVMAGDEARVRGHLRGADLHLAAGHPQGSRRVP